MKPLRATFLSIVPSPYQRDLFRALAARPEVGLSVVYCEPASPDSPWPERALQPHESVLKGFHLNWGGSRFIINRQLPSTSGADVLVLNGYVTLPAQILSRTRAHRTHMLFWGEKMVGGGAGLKGAVQRVLARPVALCDGIVAIGRGAHADYQRRYPGKPVYSLPYYCDLAAFRARPVARPRTPPTILFCGQMIARKGVDILLEAFARLTARGLDARLLLVGREADLPAMLARVPDAARARIEYAGFQAPEDLPAFFEKADIFVLPSRYDGWGVVVNQAAGAGLPLVCSDAVGAAPDLIEPGVNGHIYPAEDATRLEQILAGYVADPDSIRRAGEASLARSYEIDPERGAARWVEILQEVVAR